MVAPIYLDYNGTTPHDPEVIAAMRPFLESEFGNPSSSHWYGIRPKRAVENARRQVADLLGCDAGEVFFTSGGTESNNHAIKGMARARKADGRHLITTTVEHPAVLEVCRYLEQEASPRPMWMWMRPAESTGMPSARPSGRTPSSFR